MKITIEFDTVEQLAGMLAVRDEERDSLIAKLAIFSHEPLAFSLPALAKRVNDDMPSLTIDQRDQLTRLINRG